MATIIFGAELRPGENRRPCPKCERGPTDTGCRRRARRHQCKTTWTLDGPTDRPNTGRPQDRALPPSGRRTYLESLPMKSALMGSVGLVYLSTRIHLSPYFSYTLGGVCNPLNHTNPLRRAIPWLALRTTNQRQDNSNAAPPAKTWGPSYDLGPEGTKRRISSRV